MHSVPLMDRSEEGPRCIYPMAEADDRDNDAVIRMQLTCEVRDVKVTKAAGSVASGLRSRCSLPFLIALAKAWMRSR